MSSDSTKNRSTTPTSDEFISFISKSWADSSQTDLEQFEQAPFAASRREILSKHYPGKRIIVPAGSLKQRANDTNYAFRAHTVFTYLTGWGRHSEPDSILVLNPCDNDHTATLYFRERAGRESSEFYANPHIGEFWIGARPSLDQVAQMLGIKTAPLAAFADTILENISETLIVREADPQITQLCDAARKEIPSLQAETCWVADAGLFTMLSEMRLVKDSYEIEQMTQAVEATKKGFCHIITNMPAITSHTRGERIVEGVFYTCARAEGNAVGYETIAASGAHACILHWTRNDGPVRAGDLLLIDAGVEIDSYYTADITRTLPVSGTFTDIQREVYEAVREAADAAFNIVRPGITFSDIHGEAMKIIAAKTASWGFLPVSAEKSLEQDAQYHRRYMIHGTSHHLGLDVHDCAAARREMYLEATVKAGMIFTIEPGLYFQEDDLSVPEEFRGIGVRIEDNILVTATGARNLSAHIPRTADEVEGWMQNPKGF